MFAFRWLVSNRVLVTPPGDGKRKACQYRALDPCAVHNPFLITSSLARIKGGAAHPSESDMYVCDLCNRSFSTQGSLKRHRESVHRQSPPPPSPSPAPPERHVERPVCDLCTKIFASQKTLKRHRQTVHRQSGGFSCRVCGRHFYRMEQLKRHHIS